MLHPPQILTVGAARPAASGILSAAFGVVVAVCSAVAGEVPERLDLGALPAEMVDGDVLVPVPAEVLAVLTKLGESGWEEVLSEIERRPRGLRSREDHALALGVAVADGFLAVEANSAEAVGSAGRAVLARAEVLGMRRAVSRHCQAIFDAAEAGNWTGVRAELDRIEVTARETMREQGDGDLAPCVSLGGWLRGTELAAVLIGRSYSEDKAELLLQPELVRHFKRVAATRDTARMAAIAAALDEIGGVLARSPDAPGADGVEAIADACSRAVGVVTGSALAGDEDGTGEGGA